MFRALSNLHFPNIEATFLYKSSLNLIILLKDRAIGDENISLINI